MADLHRRHMRTEISFKTYCSSMSPSGTFCQIWNLEQCWHYSLTPRRIDHSDPPPSLSTAVTRWREKRHNISESVLALFTGCNTSVQRERTGWWGTSSTCLEDYFQSLLFVLLEMNSYSMMMDIFSLKGKRLDYQITGYQIWTTDHVGCSGSLCFYVCA